MNIQWNGEVFCADGYRCSATSSEDGTKFYKLENDQRAFEIEVKSSPSGQLTKKDESALFTALPDDLGVIATITDIGAEKQHAYSTCFVHPLDETDIAKFLTDTVNKLNRQ